MKKLIKQIHKLQVPDIVGNISRCQGHWAIQIPDEKTFDSEFPDAHTVVWEGGVRKLVHINGIQVYHNRSL